LMAHVEVVRVESIAALRCAGLAGGVFAEAKHLPVNR
jgi:hypothetical protein